MIRSTVASLALAALAAPALAECPHAKAAAQAAAAQHHAVVTTVAHTTAGAEADIVDTAVAAGSFKTLVAAVQAAGLVDALKGEGPLTVFAPTDEAFAKIPASTIESLLKPENKDQLVKILTYHVVPGRIDAAQVVSARAFKTLQGGEIAIGVAKGKVLVDGAKVVKTDIGTSNGVIHVIDTVLMPAE
ncbi:MAG: fasciclin domain-containing protein [Lacipirellulaceae bacterium]